MESKIWQFLYERIQNPYGVSGLMGNLYVESKFKSVCLEGKYARRLGMTSEEYTKAVDDGTYTNFVHDSAGYGLVQWTYWSRKESLLEYAKAHNFSVGDFDTQLNFMWEEIQKYKTVINTLYTATSVKEASDVVAIRYEKPEKTTEAYLQNRANYGQQFYDKYAEGNMNTYAQVSSMLAEWKNQGMRRPDIVVKLANACLGWSYVFGARGVKCTPSNRRAYFKSKGKPTIKSKCKNFEGDGSCSGCQWYPSGVTLFFDCMGFTYFCLLNGAGIKIMGGGATSQYNDDSNWDEKGLIENMPKDKVCCVFRHDDSKNTMEHTLLYDGNGHYIHCSGTVKKCNSSSYKATHYAIPRGLYGGDQPVITATVTAKSGSTVNVRSRASTSSSIVTRVTVGSTVTVIAKGTEWSNVRVAEGKEGYMMNQFLIFHDEPSGDTVTVKKSDLETIYAMIGAMLGK